MKSSKLNGVKVILRNLFSELIGTAILVFLGCLGVCKGLGQEGDHTGVVLSFAFAVFIAVQIIIQLIESAILESLKAQNKMSTTVSIKASKAMAALDVHRLPSKFEKIKEYFLVTCHNSGGHVNPAVTVLSLFFKKLTFPMAGVYICGQIIGGIVGFGFLRAITPSHLVNSEGFETYGLCSTVPNPNLTLVQALFAEFLFTAILLFVVCSAWDPRNAHHDSLTIKFGFAIYSLAYAGVAYTGCSMNPARSFGPAVWNQTWKHHWIYWVGPLLAAVFCGFSYTSFFCPKLPSPRDSSERSGKAIDLEMNT